MEGKPRADFVCPGHHLHDTALNMLLERHRSILKQGAVLVDPSPSCSCSNLRVLFFVEHNIQDAGIDHSGQRRIISRRLLFAEIDEQGIIRPVGDAPYLDYRPVAPEEMPAVKQILDRPWLRANHETDITTFVVRQLIPEHLAETKRRKEEIIAKTMAAVKDRLTKEISYWDRRAQELKAKEAQQEGYRSPLNSMKAQKRADELTERLKHRLEELEMERHISPSSPLIIASALIIPASLLAQSVEMQDMGIGNPQVQAHAQTKERVEKLAMEAVMDAERGLGFEPLDVSSQRLPWDIESRDPANKGKLRFLEVKGRAFGAPTVTLTKNEIITALNKPDDFILAIVEVNDNSALKPKYIRRPCVREPDFAAASVNYKLEDLLENATEPK